MFISYIREKVFVCAISALEMVLVLVLVLVGCGTCSDYLPKL